MNAAVIAPASDLPLTEQFLQHGRYLRDWSPQTVTVYRLALRECPAVITKASLNAAVIAMRDRGLSAGGINLRIRAINSFLTWMHEDGHAPERFRLKLLKNPAKPIQTLTDKDIRLLAACRPAGHSAGIPVDRDEFDVRELGNARDWRLAHRVWIRDDGC